MSYEFSGQNVVQRELKLRKIIPILGSLLVHWAELDYVWHIFDDAIHRQ